MTDVTLDAFSLALAAERSLIDQALARIESDAEAGTALADLRGRLVTLLAMLARDPGIDAASDDLYQAALAFSGEADRHDRIRRQRMVREAVSRLDERLVRAAPRES